MSALFARLFVPTYTQSIQLASGQVITMQSREPFTLDVVADHLCPAVPVKQPSMFRRALPWILIGFLIIGLGISGYFNWDQSQKLDLANKTIDSLQHDNQAQWEDYNTLREDYDSLSQELDYAQHANDENLAHATKLESDKSELLSKLDELSIVIHNTRNQASTADDTAYSLVYEKTHPTEDEIYTVFSDIRSVSNGLNSLDSDLSDYLNQWGQ